MLSELLLFLSSNLLYFALHLEKTNQFPKPLSPSEEQLCFERMHDGDSSARDKLIEHNLRLVAHIAKKYSSPSCEPDDLLSIGTIGLIKAVSTFSAEKGNRFSSYASRCIENEILMYFRSVKKSSSDVYINDPIETDKDGNPLTLLDIIADETNIIDIIDLKLKSEQLHYLVEHKLEPREKTIIELRYGLSGYPPLTQREIAKKLWISRSYVSHRHYGKQKTACRCMPFLIFVRPYADIPSLP